MRVLVVKQDGDADALGGLLLNARLSAPQATAALANLQALNPHVDIKKLKAGQMLLVPDAPGFKVSATDSVQGQGLQAFTDSVTQALGATAERLKAGNAARASERADVLAVLKLAAVKRLIDSDADLKQQVAESTRSFKDDDQQAADLERNLASAIKAASAKLTEIGKLLG